MNDRLTAAALTLAHLTLTGGLAASGLATPAHAQSNRTMAAEFQTGATPQPDSLVKTKSGC